MKSHASLLLRLCAIIMAGAGLVSCETLTGKPKFTITFHAQASEMDPPKTMFPYDLEGRRRLFKIVPEASQQNITAFHPFPAESGNGNGVALKLDFRGSSAIDIITRTRKDEYLLTLVNGKPVVYSVGNFVMKETDNANQRIGWVLELTLGKAGVVSWRTHTAAIDMEGIPTRAAVQSSPCGKRGQEKPGVCSAAP